jgi:RHS repeat-associated protein
VEDLKSGLWSQHVYNRYGLPIEYYDSFQWKKSYTYNFTQGGGTPIGFTPYIVSYHKFYSQGGQYKTVYTYDQGLRLYRKRNDYLKTERRFFYDGNGILSQMNHRNVSGYSGFPEVNLYFNRDNSGIITSITGDKGLNALYNPELEITGVHHTLPTIFDESYTYDSRGNRLNSLTGTYTYNNLNRLEASGTHTYQYDADGNLVEEKNTTTGETKKYYYDSENRLTAYEHYPAVTSPADITATYTYDIFGRRLQKNVNGVVTNFSWEDDNLAYELDAAYQPIRRYVYGAGKDDVEGYVEFSEVDGFVFDSYKKGWYTYVKDQVGTVYKVYSDYAKQIVDTRTYDTFGNLISQTGISNGNLGFQSKYFDQENGLYYFYHRYYNPANGRFVNEDPIGLNGGLNMYAFVNNNPIKWIDPYGLDWREDHPDWLDLACLLYRAADYGESQQEWGSWLYGNEMYPWDTSNWWPPSGEGACAPGKSPPRGPVCGSIHTHPRFFPRSFKRRPHRPLSYGDKYWAKHTWHKDAWGNPQQMYVISRRGIWSAEEQIISYKDFENWCKCRGLW